MGKHDQEFGVFKTHWIQFVGFIIAIYLLTSDIDDFKFVCF